jgi:hypothetical protein
MPFDTPPLFSIELKYVTRRNRNEISPQAWGDLGGSKSFPSGEGFRLGRKSPGQGLGRKERLRSSHTNALSHFRCTDTVALLHGCLHETREERVRRSRAALEFGMELATDEVGVIR